MTATTPAVTWDWEHDEESASAVLGPHTRARLTLVVDQDPDLSWLEPDKSLPRAARVSNAKRLAAYHRGDWCMTGVTVEVYHVADSASDAPYWWMRWQGACLLGGASLFGVESDCSREYLEEVAADLLADAMAAALTMKAALMSQETEHPAGYKSPYGAVWL